MKVLLCIISLLIICIADKEKEFMEYLDKNVTQMNCMLGCLGLCEARMQTDIAAINQTLESKNKTFSVYMINHILFTMIKTCMNNITQSLCDEIVEKNNTIMYEYHTPYEKYCTISYADAIEKKDIGFYKDLINVIPGIAVNSYEGFR